MVVRAKPGRELFLREKAGCSSTMEGCQNCLKVVFPEVKVLLVDVRFVIARAGDRALELVARDAALGAKASGELDVSLLVW